MRKKRNKIWAALFVCFISLAILALVFLKWGYPYIVASSGTTESESESVSESESISESETESEVETESESETEPESEATPQKKPSYLEQCELNYVEPPVIRNYEQALEKIKELSQWFPALHHVYDNHEQYPPDFIVTIVGNPEMTDFAYRYLTTEPVATGGFTEDEIPEEYPLFLQWDIRWGYMPYGTSGNNMGISGCGPTCLSMASFYLTGNRECTPQAIAQYSMDKGYYVPGAGTAWALLDNYPAEIGLISTRIGKSEAKLKSELDKGNILICSVRAGNFTTAGHFIVIYGYDENGFKVNDPKCIYRSRLTWTYEQIKNDIKQTWSIGK